MNRLTPTLVLLPGMDGTGKLFATFAAIMEREFDTLIITYPPDIQLSYTALESLVRKSLPTDRPFVLLGESFSGPIAISLSARQLPQQVGLVLCSTFARNPRPIFRHLSFLLGALPFSLVPVGWISKLLLGRFSTRALRVALRQAIPQVSPSVMRSRLRSVLAVDVSAKLAQVSVPTIYLRAKHDSVVPGTASALVSSMKRDTRIIEIEAPHCLLQVAPEEAAGHIREFLRTLEGI
ncbi:alpha/beta hydrolase [Pseudomonas caspiana]|nr:alpha/beta hydrolase [Pseudomonas caspiana]TPG96116.1 alpha/beta hydrolase [Pseudomonas caspiana]